MTDDIKQDRSPRSPKVALEDAIAMAKRLYDNAGRSTVKREVAVKAMGYNGLNGASLTTLATLAQYGLIEKDGGDLKISPLALQIFHPTTQDERGTAIQHAALAPPVFKSIYESHDSLSEDVLANHLIHQGFTQDASKKAASVYKQNSVFAKLDQIGTIENKKAESDPFAVFNLTSPAVPPTQMIVPPAQTPTKGSISALIESFTLPVPVGDRVAIIPFPIEEEDFDLLIKTLNLWKSKLVKKSTSTEPDCI